MYEAAILWVAVSCFWHYTKFSDYLSVHICGYKLKKNWLIIMKFYTRKGYEIPQIIGYENDNIILSKVIK